MRKIRIFTSFLLIVLLILPVVLLAACDKKDDGTEGRYLVEEEVFLKIDIKKSTISNITVALFLDPNKSGIILRTDGTATLRLVVADAVSTALGEFDLSGEDISTVLGMIYEYLPGLDLADFDSIENSFKGGLGISILGVEDDNQEIRDFFAALGETGKLPQIPTLPSGFGLEINAEYYFKDLTSAYTDKTYTGIFWGRHHPDGEAFLLMDVKTNEDTQKSIVVMDYSMIDLYFVTVEKEIAVAK